MLDLSTLIVFHYEIDQINGHSTKTTGLFKKISAQFFAFRPVTCVRQILVFHGLEAKESDSLREKLQCLDTGNFYCGSVAYLFLLRWSVGLLNTKMGQNDRFVLGRFRECWTKFSIEHRDALKDHEFVKIIPAVLQDAHLIRKKIETTYRDLLMKDRVEATEQLCQRHLDLRVAGFSPSVACNSLAFWSKQLELPSREQVIARGRYLSRTLRKLQETLIREEEKGCESRFFPYGSGTKPFLGTMSASIGAVWEKKQLQRMLEDDTMESPSESM